MIWWRYGLVVLFWQVVLNQKSNRYIIQNDKISDAKYQCVDFCDVLPSNIFLNWFQNSYHKKGDEKGGSYALDSVWRKDLIFERKVRLQIMYLFKFKRWARNELLPEMEKKIFSIRHFFITFFCKFEISLFFIFKHPSAILISY